MADDEKQEPKQTTTRPCLALAVPSDPTHVYPKASFPPLSAFESSETYCALKIPASRTAELRNSLRDVLLHRPKTKNVYKHPTQSDCRILVLKRSLKENTYENDIYKDPVVASLFKEDAAVSRCNHVVVRTYQDLSVEEVLSALLPHEKEVPCAFEIIGNLAHVNLRPELLPYKYMVGNAILDKNAPRISTVVNKIGSIENEFRTFDMEVIAGGNKDGSWNSIAQVKEEKCVFELDFQKVYWNSRLCFEHRRLVRLIQSERHKQKDEPIVVADVMAGVGPFAVPLTSTAFRGSNNKKQASTSHNTNIVVHANDLNPTSYHYLNINSKKNKCRNLHTYNMDGRAFVHDLDQRGIRYDHVIMNLPAIAPEFLNAFWSCPWVNNATRPPRIHVYCFGGKEMPQAQVEATERCSKALRCTLEKTQHNVSVHIVRDVSPKKNMLCLSFTLPQQLASIPRLVLTDTKQQGEPDAKRIKKTET